MAEARPFNLASSNRSKVALFQKMLGERWTVEPLDPGNAEAMAPIGYASGALAKARSAARMHGFSWAVGHDSGFEFECLDGGPGPLTHRTMSRLGVSDFTKLLVPESEVAVVHCLALWSDLGQHTFIASDARRVRSDIKDLRTEAPSGLPLGALVIGPATALQEGLDSMATALEKYERLK